MSTEATADAHRAGSPSSDRRHLPPVAELVVASVALMLIGGVYLGAHLPTRPSLAPAWGLLGAGAALTALAHLVAHLVHRGGAGRPQEKRVVCPWG